jgi:hypothetical protein
MQAEEVKRVVASATDEEAAALVTWYANLSAAVAQFPASELKDVEPPLRSIGGPKAA